MECEIEPESEDDPAEAPGEEAEAPEEEAEVRHL